VSLWSQLKTHTQGFSTQLKTKVGQFQNKEFANASMAMCALIAAADGRIDDAERTKVSALITSNDVLAVFPPAELTTKFDIYCNKLSTDFNLAKVELTQVVAKVRPKPDQARAVIQIGIIIGGADGNFDPNERAVVREACLALGVSPQEFDL